MAIVPDSARPADIVTHGFTIRASVADEHVPTPDDGSITPNVGGSVGAIARTQDGVSAGIMLPDWHALVVDEIVGDSATMDAGTVVITEDGTYTLEARAEVRNNYGQYVVFGASKNGAMPPVEIARAQCNSNDFVFVITQRAQRSYVEGDTVELFVSSTFQWAEFAWRNVEFMALKQGS